MNYEEKYEQALERAKTFKSPFCQAAVETIFPELRESEDEKMRREIVEFLIWLKEFRSGGYEPSGKYVIEDMIAWLEKQKTANKVEPKFKVGDWIVTPDDETKQIEKVGFGNYYFTDKTLYNIIDTDNNGYLWTIQDAKDGDVLAEDSCMFIIEKMKSEGMAMVYCCLFDDGDFDLIGSTLIFDVDSTYPATKEQRDLLLQKMKEAGYEWDDEKKNLKKVEQNCYHNDGLYYAIDILEKTFGKVEGYQSDDGIIEHQTAIETVNALYHKKPVEWSEEDERIHTIKVFYPSIGIGVEEAVEKCIAYSKKEGDMLISINGIFLLVTQLSTVEKVMEEYNKCVGNSNDIKEKVNSLIQWTTDDESYLKGVICDIECEVLCANCSRNIADMKINWLKSLKDRVQQPKQEWSEGDEEKFNSIMEVLGENSLLI